MGNRLLVGSRKKYVFYRLLSGLRLEGGMENVRDVCFDPPSWTSQPAGGRPIALNSCEVCEELISPTPLVTDFPSRASKGRVYIYFPFIMVRVEVTFYRCLCYTLT